MGHLGGLEGLLEALRDHLGVLKEISEILRAILGRRRLPRAKTLSLQWFFVGFWSELGHNWLGLGAIGRVWRAILGGLGGHLGGLGGHFGRSGGPSWKS